MGPLNVCFHLTPLLTALSASRGKEEAAFVSVAYLQNLAYFRSHLLQRALSIDFFETDALMEISTYTLVSKMSSFNQLLLSERLCCISSLETLRHQGVQVQPLASIVQYNLQNSIFYLLKIQNHHFTVSNMFRAVAVTWSLPYCVLCQ